MTRARTLILVSLWATLLLVGLGWQFGYAYSPGAARATPARWPEHMRALDTIPLPAVAAADASLVMALHPQCPCSQASLAEAARILDHFDGRVRLVILAASPAGLEAAWADTPVIRAARDLPHAVILDDPDGRMAAAFGMMTSGHVAAYDRAGRLFFSGGITGSRGHRGDNPASTTLIAGIASINGVHGLGVSPVFGCGLVCPLAAHPSEAKP